MLQKSEAYNIDKCRAIVSVLEMPGQNAKSKMVGHLVGHKLCCVINIYQKCIFCVCVCVCMYFLGVSLSVAKGYPPLDIEQLDVIIFNSKNAFMQNTEE